MILILANPFRGPLEGVGPENRAFLAMSEASANLEINSDMQSAEETPPVHKIYDYLRRRADVSLPYKRKAELTQSALYINHYSEMTTPWSQVETTLSGTLNLLFPRQGQFVTGRG